MSSKKQNNINALLFDFGGTIDTGGDHWYHVLYPLMQTHISGLDSTHYRQAFAYGERTLATEPHIQPSDNFLDLLIKKLAIQASFLQNNGIEFHLKGQLEVARAAYQFAKHNCLLHSDLLRQLKLTYRLALVSNFYGNLTTVLQDFELTAIFETVVESAVVGVKKPDPAIFTMACERLQLAAENVVVIGDSYQKDMLPALSIGCSGYWLQGRGWADSTASEAALPLIPQIAAGMGAENSVNKDEVPSITPLQSLQDLPGLLRT